MKLERFRRLLGPIDTTCYYLSNFRGIPPRVVQADCGSFQMRLHIISILSCTFNCNKSVRVLLHGGYHIMGESSDELVS
ncbi:unnamed protein product [Rhizophagus irregularis]|nr:unnamed protein product [Rhizophagus irregularis]CAB5370545.1 unnamed protein product [Rhizophagus irregularis]